jgi:hypothetical protein
MDVNLTSLQVTLLIALALWEITWKGFALWRAARRHQSYWFVAILIINTVGLLPIIYLLLSSDRDKRDAAA